ncbi:MAG: polyphosphate kinase 2 family protein [Firmicutes bacterium]|nr:polyphosphate kinase 2 family protein [Bacillota bacterium]
MDYEKQFRYDGKDKLSLKQWAPDDTADFHDKAEALGEVEQDINKLRAMQDMLYAQGRYAVLIVFQGIDAAGKDSTISHVMSGINPQGCRVVSFKTPSEEDLSHDYLWRINKNLPERGKIGIFNRSYYEEVLITKVHPEFVLSEKIPGIDSLNDIDKAFWKRRYDEIRDYEKYLSNNGFIIIKFFLHLSKGEQRKRFLKRIDQKEKNWKLSVADMKERALWDNYQTAFEEAISHTATAKVPWYIVPADNKWFTQLAVSKIVNERISQLHLSYPEVPEAQMSELAEIKAQLLNEKQKKNSVPAL